VTLRFSRELADDEGRVFLAYAPPRSLVVLGRRDPRNGELCVSKFFRKPPEAPWPDPNDTNAPAFEHVTGPEAEHLLDAIARWMDDGAPGANWINRSDERAGREGEKP
jgi:hypothetical protein